MWLDEENGSVIVTCERCETQFQLDEARVPESGARVRCSRCKHAFVVQPPSASAASKVEQAVSDAVRVGEAPDVTEDLPDPVAAAASEDANADSDWQFNHDDAPIGDEDASDSDAGVDPGSQLDLGSEPDTDFGVVGPDEHLALAGEDDEDASDERVFEVDADDSLFGVAGEDAEPPKAAAKVATAPASARAGAAGIASDGAETLGTPDEWDIFDDLTGAGKTPPSAPAQRSEPAKSPSLELASDGLDAEPEAPRAAATAFRADAQLWVGRVGGVAGWALTAMLCAVGFTKGLAPPSAATPEIAVAAGLRVEDAAGRWVDNALLGRLYVVSGQLRQAGSASEPVPPLELVMLDAGGDALEPTWRLDSPRPGAVLREGSPDTLAAVRAGFRRPLAAGEPREFEVVAWPLPREADRFEIRVSETDR